MAFGGNAVMAVKTGHIDSILMHRFEKLVSIISDDSQIRFKS